ncbi:MAG: branched-chain amino acid ABC transporter permease [Candidatus Velthaea sp.]
MSAAPPSAKRFFSSPLLWTAVVLAVLPFVAGANPLHWTGGFIDIATTMLCFALFASGFNLLFGHLGELSFGHAMFFAIASYATALYTKGFDLTLFGHTLHHNPAGNMLVALAWSIGLVLLWGWFLARLIVPRSSGIYYSMITLAFAQVIFFITYKFGDFTGGEDGIQGIPRPQIIGLPADWLASSMHYYIFAAVVAFITLVVLYWIIHSPFGSVLHAIRENKERARFLGYDVNKYRVNAFVLSTLFPAVGGWLWAYYQTSINPDAGSVAYSGNVVMMSLLGGIYSFFGPILGAIIYWELQNGVSQVTKYWEAWIGIVFVVFVLVGPRGIMGLLDDLRRYGVGTFLRRTFSRRARVQTDLAEELPTVSQ